MLDGARWHQAPIRPAVKSRKRLVHSSTPSALPFGIPLFAGGDHARLDLVLVYSGLAQWVAPLLLTPPMFSRDVDSYRSWPVAVAVAVSLNNAAAVVVLIRWYFMPIRRRRGWPLWMPCALMFLGFLVFEPSRDTFSYGQLPGSSAYVWLSLVVLAALTQEAWLPGRVLAHGMRAEADRSCELASGGGPGTKVAR